MDVDKRLKSMRLTPEEEEKFFLALMDKVTPKTEEKVALTTAYEFVDEAKKLRVTGDKIIGTTSGYSEIDSFTRGFAAGDMIVVFGGTSHGKSQVAQNITWRLARKGTAVLFLGLEMTRAQNNARFMDIADWMGDEYEFLNNIVYPTSNEVKLSTIESCIREGVKEGVKLVVIDQLQQLTRSVDNRTNETSMITAEVKRMAVKYQIPVMLLAHINRTAEVTSPPTLQSLKDSSSIEQDADICIAVWRDMNPQHGQQHIVELVNRKNRNRGHVGEGATLQVEGGVGLKQLFDS